MPLSDPDNISSESCCAADDARHPFAVVYAVGFPEWLLGFYEVISQRFPDML